MKKEELVSRIRRKDVEIAVVGLGHVGLPTAAIFANAGFPVTGMDLNEKIVENISQGKSPVDEQGLEEIVKKTVKEGRLKATTKPYEALKEAGIVVICVQTPLREDGKPNLTYLKNACQEVAKNLKNGKLIIIGSTVPPRTTKDFVVPLIEAKSQLRCGIDFWLTHCPERAASGKILQEFLENPRIIGGLEHESIEIATKLYRTVVKAPIMVTDSVTAEVAKLAENTFRDVNIALANELALICEEVGADVMDVVRLSNTHPRIRIHSPGCGVGGPCLPKDPYLLLHPAAKKGFRSKTIQSSREVNDYMPKHVAELVVNALRNGGKDIRKSKIAILGAAYKGEVGDVTNSPSEKIIHHLMRLGTHVVVYDPYSQEGFGAKRVVNLVEAVKKADCVVIATDHKMFKELDLKRIKELMKENPIIVDGRRQLEPFKIEKIGFNYLAVGRGLKI